MTAQGQREDDSPVQDRKTERTPLPKLQVFIAFLIQFAEPVTATVIYPFVNQFVRETGITGGDEAKTGYYAGMVITDSTNIGDAYALTPIMWSSGTTIGPTLGGVLSNPATRWPDTFGRVPFFHRHPYFLPCAAAAFIAFLSFLISAVALKETLPPSRRTKLSSLWRRGEKKPHSDETTPLLTTDATADHCAISVVESAETEEERPPLSQLFVPSFVVTIVNYGLLAFVDMSMSALIPLVYSTPIEYGGLGMDPLRIGSIMGTFAIINGMFSGLFLGPLIRRYGTLKIYRTGILSFFIAIAGFPIANALARKSGGIDAYVMLVVVSQFVVLGALSPCYASMMLMVIQNAPSKLLLGSANGAAQMVTSGSRALAPAFASSLFSLSIQHNLLGGYAVYYIFVILSAVVVQGSRYLPSPPSAASQ